MNTREQCVSVCAREQYKREDVHAHQLVGLGVGLSNVIDVRCRKQACSKIIIKLLRNQSSILKVYRNRNPFPLSLSSAMFASLWASSICLVLFYKLKPSF